MKAIIFDIDGTLTQTTEVDSRCFVQAVQEVLGVQEFDTEWSNYQFVTDSGVAQEISQRYCDRPMSGSLTKAFHERLVTLLKEQERESFMEVPGAIEFLKRLQASPDYAVSLATGAHRESALYKLEAAGFEITDIPLASSSDAVVREHIMLQALDRSARQERARFTSVTYFGDAHWDVEATKNLGWRLVGIGPKIKTEWVFPDYTQAEEIIQLL